MHDKENVTDENFNIAINELWAATYKTCSLSNGLNFKIDGHSFQQTSPWYDELSEACAQVCLKIDDVIREGNMDQAWLRRHILKTPFPLATLEDRVKLLSTRAAAAQEILKTLPVAETYLQEETHPEEMTPLRDAILSLIWSIAMVCKADHNFYRSIERKRFDWLVNQRNAPRYENRLLKDSLPEFDLAP